MTAMLRNLLLGTISLIVLGLILHVTAGEAAAQFHPAKTKNVDEPGRIPYQKTVQTGNSDSYCGGFGGWCNLVFPAVPTGKRLVVEHVSVKHVCQSPSQVIELLLLADPFNLLDIAPVGSTIGRVTTVDKPVRFYFEAGQGPVLNIVSDCSDPSARGTLVGYLIDAVN